VPHAPPAAPLLALALVALAPQPALGWGEAGHEVIAAIAEARLSPGARRMVREIVGELPLSDPGIATWADAQREQATRPWHFVNIPFSAPGYAPERDCPRGACAVAAIDRAATDLARGGGSLRRADALRWLVHLVADLHQPLHAGDGRDRGGNDLPVRIGRRREPTNLHKVWDGEVLVPIVGRRGSDVAARELGARIRPAEAAAWMAVRSPAAWAEESRSEAKAIYEALGRVPGDRSTLRLPAGYARSARPRVEAALQRAGVRLAALLDRVASERAAGGSGP
jgi:hypothetical protein